MADALKTFSEGQDIKASDTNANNNFLLSKLSDNAAQVQSYVENEISSMKSQISSVQATLQTNINNLKTEFNETLNNIFGAISPNYSKGINISSGYKATSYGVGYVRFNANSSSGYAYVNGYEVAFDGGSVNYHQTSGSSFIVAPGSTITATNYAVLKFYPCKGF